MTDTDTVWCAGEEWCPVTVTASLIGKKWRPVIVHRLLKHGELGFAALQDEIEDISSKVLSENLEEMEEKKLIDRTIVSERPFRVEYSLTERGESLEPIITEMRDWGKDYVTRFETDDRTRETSARVE